jgi:hypothetical protein
MQQFKLHYNGINTADNVYYANCIILKEAKIMKHLTYAFFLMYFSFFPHQLAGLYTVPGTPVSSTNKTDCLDKTEILLKVALNTITH